MRTRTNLAAFTLGLALALAQSGPAATNHPPQAGFGTALTFNAAANQYVQIADTNDLDLTNNYSIECWFKADSFGGLRGLVTKYQTADAAGWFLRLADKDLDFDAMRTSGLNLRTGRWYHVAAVNTNGTRHLYLNGVEQPLSGTPSAVQTNGDPVCLGVDYLSSNDRFFAGTLDEVRIWKTVLSGTVVSNWMYRSADVSHPAWSKLGAYYKLDDGTGTTAADSAGAHPGTLQGMAGTEWTDSTVGRQYACTAGQTIGGQLPGSDPDGASSNGANWALTFEIVNQPTHGTATVVSANVFTYPVPFGAGPAESFTYRVRDASNAVSGVATVTVAVASNHPPQAGFGTALAFDGVDDYVSLPAGLATAVGGRDAITIEYWFNGSQLQSPVRFQDGDGYIVAGWSPISPVHAISTDGGTDNGLSVGPVGTVTNGQWHHLAMAWQRNTTNGFRSYLDGTLVAQRDSADAALPSLGSATPYLGCYDGPSELLAGQLDEVRIWKTALSATTISNWMYREIDLTHPAFANLTAYYKLNDGTGTTAADSAGAYDGTLQNMSGSAWTDSTIGRRYAAEAGQSLNGQLPGSDVDGSSSNGADWTLTFQIVNQPAHGTAAVVSANVFSYPVPPGASPVESFTYRVRDPGSLVSGVATVTVAVTFPAPLVDITNNPATVIYAVTNCTIGGTNNPFVVGTMRWTNDANGVSSTFAATSPWQVTGIPLAVGANLITVFATNVNGVLASDSVAIARSSEPAPLVDITNNPATVAYAVTNYAIGGTNNAWVVGRMWWTNGANGAGSTFAAASPWQVTGIPLATGANQIAVFGTNASGAVAGDSVTITRFASPPLTRYVWTNSPSPGSGYTNWTTAARTIQAAVDAANDGDTVLVTNGTYASGGMLTPGYGLSNRVCVTKVITVRSVNGPTNTFIVGAADPGSGGNGTAAVRCVYLVADAVVSGFTLTNGHTRSSGEQNLETGGAGVLLFHGGTASNCVIAGCSSAGPGGGVNLHHGGVLSGCIVRGNHSDGSGGGMLNEEGQAANCLVSGNTAAGGGGGVFIYSRGLLANCTVAGNFSANPGGGVCGNAGGTNVNCIVYANTDASGDSNYYFPMGGGFFLAYSCTMPDPGGFNNVIGDPQFRGSDDYRLRYGSPCVDAGNNAYAPGSCDLDGNPRIVKGTVDIGAYELQRFVVITNPAVSVTTVFGEVATYTIAGTNAPSIVGKLAWTNSATGSNGTLNTAASWSIPNVSLAWGGNPIAVSGTNAAGEVSGDSVQIVRSTVYGGVSPNHYAWTNSPSEAWPYTNWTTAARTLQKALDAANSNDTVVATNGAYSAGGATAPGSSLTNRACIVRPVALRSVNGPAKTIIVGAADPVSTYGPAAVRCVYLTPSAVVSGFTLTNGHTAASGDWLHDASGGGVFFDQGGTLTNCTVTGNSSSAYGRGGGGAYCDGGGTLNNCLIGGNSSASSGGGAYCHSSTLNNCLITGNSTANYGGGAYLHAGSILNSCTVAGNSAGYSGGGVYGAGAGSLCNSIVYFNTPGGARDADGSFADVEHTCAPGFTGNGNLPGDPQFVDRERGDYHLRSGSTCVDAGTNGFVSGTADLDGNPRIVHGTVDMGAYEFQYLLAITNPAGGGATVFGEVATYTIAGTNAPSIVGKLAWTNSATGSNGTLSAASSWSIPNVSLAWGANLIMVSGTNTSGTVYADSVLIFRSTVYGGPSPVHYVWTNSPSEAWPYTNWASAARTIQQAVDTANDNDTVRVTNGAYRTGGTITPGYALTNRACIVRPITLLSVNGPSNTFIVGAADPVTTNGPASVRCLYVTNNAVVSGFTLTNGHSAASGDWTCDESGGGALLDGGGILTNCIVTGNSSVGDAGGVYCNGGGTLNNCVIAGNVNYYYDSGGVYCYHGGTLNACTITGNSSFGDGGGVYCYGGGALTNCTITGNTASYDGGGVYCDGGGALDNCAINGNSASDDGGGVYLSGGEGGPYGALDHCTISSNSASDGGGVYCEGGTLDHCAINGNSASASGGGYCGGGTLNNCLIAGNSAGGGWDGGGVYCWGSTLNNCTIAGNSADPGRCGGVYVDEGGTLSNSIAYFNTPAGADIGSNYAYTANNCCSPGLSGSGNITNNPQFMGGTNYHLQATSPCIDAGNNAYMPSATDLDGTPRPLDGDANGTAIVDMGCYEFVNGNADSDGDTMKDGWEQDHGLDPTDPSDASANPDNDPFNNRDEHTADTDPTNAASYFHVAAISNLPPPTVSFLSSSNRKYTLHGLTNLVLGVWTNVPGAGPRAGKGGADSMQDTNVPAKGPFYRLTVDLP